MTELNNQQFGLCDIQGRLFELALKNGYDCKDFIEKFMNSKAHLVGQGGKGLLENSKEALMCAYSLTMSLSSDKSKFTNPVFK